MLRTPFLVFSLQGRQGVRCSHYAGEEGLSCKVFGDLKSWHGRQKHLTNIEALIVLCSVLKRREAARARKKCGEKHETLFQPMAACVICELY